MKLAELNEEQQKFLLSLTPQATAEEHGIPVYTFVDEKSQLTMIVPELVEDFKLSPKANKAFEKNTVGLYRGGAVIKVTCAHGTCVVPDERFGWWKPFAGMARHSEGLDLRLTGARELMEEAFIYDLKKTIRFVPKGQLDAIKACTLDFTVENVLEVGEIIVLGHERNDTNKAFEAVLGWDITGIDVPYSISLEEKWFAGGRNGISVYALGSDGTITGVFSGQQGFLEFPKYGIHETLKKYL